MEGTIRPPGRNTCAAKPDNLFIERLVWAQIPKRRNLRCLKLRVARKAVEERCHSITIYQVMRAESSIRPASGKTLLMEPHHFLIPHIVRRNVCERRLFGKVNLRGACQAIEINSYTRTLNIIFRVVCAIGVTDRDFTVKKPGNLIIKSRRFRNVNKTFLGRNGLRSCVTFHLIQGREILLCNNGRLPLRISLRLLSFCKDGGTRCKSSAN